MQLTNTEERHNRGGDYKKYSVFMLTSDPSQLFNIAFLTTIDSNRKEAEGKVYWQKHIVFIGQLETP